MTAAMTGPTFPNNKKTKGRTAKTGSAVFYYIKLWCLTLFFDFLREKKAEYARFMYNKPMRILLKNKESCNVWKYLLM